MDNRSERNVAMFVRSITSSRVSLPVAMAQRIRSRLLIATLFIGSLSALGGTETIPACLLPPGFLPARRRHVDVCRRKNDRIALYIRLGEARMALPTLPSFALGRLSSGMTVLLSSDTGVCVRARATVSPTSSQRIANRGCQELFCDVILSEVTHVP